jgi:hypothetical protein
LFATIFASRLCGPAVEADPPTVAPWMICLRSAAPNQPRALAFLEIRRECGNSNQLQDF